METLTNQTKTNFDSKKTVYFSRLITQHHRAFALHKNEGRLWEERDGKRDWGNVSEHCAVEIARVRKLGKLLSLQPKTIQDLEEAAALHDFSKRKEREIKVAPGGITWQQYDEEISAYSTETILSHGFSEHVAELTDSVGHCSLIKTEELLSKDASQLNEADIAYLVMHYVDSYTRGSEWVGEASEHGNDVDLRVKKDATNPNLQNLKEDGKIILGGRDFTEVMRDTSHQIEQLFSELIQERNSITIPPLEIPQYIDVQIKEEIEKS